MPSLEASASEKIPLTPKKGGIVTELWNPIFEAWILGEKVELL